MWSSSWADECLVNVHGEVTMAVLDHFDVCEDVGRQLTDNMGYHGDDQVLPVDTRSTLLNWRCHHLLLDIVDTL